MQADTMQTNSLLDVDQFNKLRNKMVNSTDKPIIFDDIYNVKGTSLSIDTSIDVDTNIEELRSNVKAGKSIHIFITEDWSLNNKIRDFFNEI